MRFNGLSTRNWAMHDEGFFDSTGDLPFGYAAETANTWGPYTNPWVWTNVASIHKRTLPWNGFYVFLCGNSNRNGAPNGDTIEVAVTCGPETEIDNVRTVITDLPVPTGFTKLGMWVYIPLEVKWAAGERPYLRQKNAVGNEDIRSMFMPLFKGDGARDDICSGYEHVASASNDYTSSIITQSGATHTKTSWTEIGRTSKRYRWIYIVVGAGDWTTTAGNRRLLYDIGIGESGQEQVLIPNIAFAANLNEWDSGSGMTIPIHIPPGKRLSWRLQSSSTSTAYTHDIQVTGFY